jgi:hypothetical protein
MKARKLIHRAGTIKMASLPEILPPENIRKALSEASSFDDLGRAVELMTDISMPHRGEDATLFLKRVGEILAEPERFGFADLSEPDWQWLGRIVWAAYSNQGPFLTKA